MTKKLKNLGWIVIQAYDRQIGEWADASAMLWEMRDLEEDHPEVRRQQERVKVLDEALNQMVQDNPWLTIASSNMPSRIDDSPSTRHDDEVRDITLFGIGE